MSASQRRKGQVGERELFAELSDRLGTVVRRNVDQARNGGADGMDIPGWAVEVKRQQYLALASWWEQAVTQAQMAGRKPLLCYRQDRRPWRCVLFLADLVGDERYGSLSWLKTVTVDLDTAAAVIRETLTQEVANEVRQCSG